MKITWFNLTAAFAGIILGNAYFIVAEKRKIFRTVDKLEESVNNLEHNTIKALQAHINHISHLEQENHDLTRKVEELSGKLEIVSQSIDPKNKRWTRIKKVRAAVQSTRQSNSMNIRELTIYASSVIDYSDEYDVPVPLILAITKRESAFDPEAASAAGAKGLMQLMPRTAKEAADNVGRKYYDLYKIRHNVQLGTWYIYKMLEEFHDLEELGKNIDLALKAYNCGPGCVMRVETGQRKDYPQETKDYVIKVLQYKEEYERMGL